MTSPHGRDASCVLGDSGDGRISVTVGSRPVRPVPHRNRQLRERSTDDTHKRPSVRVCASVDTSATPADVEAVTPTVVCAEPGFSDNRLLRRSCSLQWRNYGRQWRQSPPGAHGKGAPRADSNVFFILFNYKILSRFVAANDTAL